MSSPSDAVLDGAVVATPQPASASELTPEVAMSTPLAGPGATADVAPTTTDATPPSPVLDVLDGQDGTEAPPASVSAENSSAATPAPSSAAPAPVQGADEGAADATDVSIDVDAEGEGKQGGIAEAKSGDVHSDTPERTAKQKFQKAVRTVLGEESDDEDDKPKGPPSKWRFVRIFVDVVVLSWCFLLPIIASTQRELDPASGTTVCVFQTPATATSSIQLDINATTMACLNNTCTKVCTTKDPEMFLPLARGWRVLIGLIPIVVVFEGILSFKLSSRYVAPFSTVYSVLLGSLFFRDAEFFADNNTLPAVMGGATLIILDRFFWAIVEYVFNVFAAFYFMRVLELWGLVENMRMEFSKLAKTPTRKVLVVAFSFAILLAVVAPGGSNYIVAGAILIEMNPSNLFGKARLEANFRIGTICLFGNALISAFNLLGICVTTIAEDIQDLAFDHPNDVEYGGRHIGRLFSLQFFIFSWVSPLIMAMLYSRQPTIKAKLIELKPEMPILLSTGFVYSLVQWLTSWLIGPELPCLTAGGLSLAWYIAVENWGHYSWPSMKKRGYMTPFILLISVLLVMRLIPYVEEGLIGDWGVGSDIPAQILNPWVWNVDSGGLKFKRHIPWLWHSGVIVAVIATVTPFVTKFVPPPDPRQGKAPLMSGLPLDDGTLNVWTAEWENSPGTVRRNYARNKVRLVSRVHRVLQLSLSEVRKKNHAMNNSNEKRKQVLLAAFKEAVSDVMPVVASITAFASVAKLMDKFGMIQVVADFLVDGLSSVPELYVLLMPVIGTLGSGLTGSTTTSNFLFGRLQVTTAKDLGLVAPGANTVYEIAATNILGASAGEIIAPMNAIVITLMKGIGGNEARLIKYVLPLTLGWLICTMIVSLIFVAPSGGFIN